MYNFLCQNVLKFAIHVLFTKRTETGLAVLVVCGILRHSEL